MRCQLSCGPANRPLSGTDVGSGSSVYNKGGRRIRNTLRRQTPIQRGRLVCLRSCIDRCPLLRYC